ncbi:phage tail sheath subtilisin-like domain-containing protein [uncultured Pseudoflavonifractor sp.]|uniref:phage tail sheath subtilisin-like domain-containing protein n=1 Tax=uncultured Pseudoflavonifractor sp. TaxID=1221379 RepID=UPI0025D5BB50|nr:phage tail sheath subtilisin-like domain-containing protein [uncultured Pseudoflavonifractor sp.]
MAATIGLPTLKIAFEKAAEQVANRSKKGYVALFVRDAQENGVHALSSEALIPSKLGEANKEYVRQCFTGSDRGGPSLVYLVVIATGTDDTTALEAGLKSIEQYSIDYLAGPPDVTDQELAKLVEWVKAQRAMYRTVKLVKPWKAAGSDDMGIIELDESGMTDKDGAVTAAEYCGRIAGILAGIPMGMSCTYAALPELTAVTARTTEEQTEAINNGKLILIHDGIQAKIARGVNSLTTIPATGKADWSKIKIVEGMDLITYFLRTTIENSWMGRYPNTYDNKQLLVTAIYNYFLELEQAGVLSAGESFVEVDYNRQLQYLQSQGVETSTLTEQQVLEYQTGSYVFLKCGGRLVDAMEDFEVLFNNL